MIVFFTFLDFITIVSNLAYMTKVILILGKVMIFMIHRFFTTTWKCARYSQCIDWSKTLVIMIMII